MSEMIKNRNIKYNKNERCFEKIFNEYKGLLTFIASSYLNNLEDIKDIVQDSFISFFNNFDNINDSIKSYLTKIVKNKCINLLKLRSKIDLIDSNDIDLESYNFENSDENFREEMNYIKKISKENEFQIFILYVLKDMSFKEISNKLNLKENTVKSIYYRAIKKYNKKLRKEFKYEKKWKKVIWNYFKKWK